VEPPERFEPLPDPSAIAWSSAGLIPGREIHGGHQSRVFDANQAGAKVAVKLTDARFVDDAFQRRLDVLTSLAEIDDSVVGPLDSPFRLDGWLAVVYPFASGRVPDPTDEFDVRQMASTLSRLHHSLSRIGPIDLPPVAALRGDDADPQGRTQILHGDFSESNTPTVACRLHVVDFDACRYGRAGPDAAH